MRKPTDEKIYDAGDLDPGLKSLILAVQQEAQRAACLFCQEIKRLRESDSSSRALDSVPLSWALRLAAAIRIQQWESAGVRKLLPMDLPDGTRAHALAQQRMDDGQLRASDSFAIPVLAAKYFKAWIQHFAWSAIEQLNAEVVLSELRPFNEDELSLLADFLWRNRRRAAV